MCCGGGLGCGRIQTPFTAMVIEYHKGGSHLLVLSGPQVEIEHRRDCYLRNPPKESVNCITHHVSPTKQLLTFFFLHL